MNGRGEWTLFGDENIGVTESVVKGGRCLTPSIGLLRQLFVHVSRFTVTCIAALSWEIPVCRCLTLILSVTTNLGFLWA